MAKNPLVFGLVGWLVPGGGYFLLKRQQQAVFFLVSVIAFFAAGLMLKGGLLWPEPQDLQGADNVSVLLMKGSALAKYFAGIPYWLARFGGYSQTFMDGFRYDMGTKLLVLAGLLNLLALSDAYNIAFPTAKKDTAEAKK